MKKVKYILIPIIVLLIIFAVKGKSKEETEIVVEKEIVSEINEKVKIDIKGYVVNPGVYELENNKKVIDAINMAGGLLENADTSRINLAKTLTDEMVIIIYSKEEIEGYFKSKQEEQIKIEYVYVENPCECPSTNDACLKKEDLSSNELISDELTEENSKISINNASKERLMTLPNIGESKADNIIEYRKTNEFKSIEDIKNVNGIGESLFEKIKDYITI